MEFRVTAYVNVHELNYYEGYGPTCPVAQVDTFAIKADDRMHALISSYGGGGMWAIGNRMACDLNGKEWPSDVRSLSVGDVVKVVTPHCHAWPHGRVDWFAVAPFGWDEIAEPTNVVPLAGQGRHTSR